MFLINTNSNKNFHSGIRVFYGIDFATLHRRLFSLSSFFLFLASSMLNVSVVNLLSVIIYII